MDSRYPQNARWRKSARFSLSTLPTYLQCRLTGNKGWSIAGQEKAVSWPALQAIGTPFHVRLQGHNAKCSRMLKQETNPTIAHLLQRKYQNPLFRRPLLRYEHCDCKHPDFRRIRAKCQSGLCEDCSATWSYHSRCCLCGRHDGLIL